jgi:hypothetical protein
MGSFAASEDGPWIVVQGVAEVSVCHGLVRVMWTLPQFSQQRRRHVRMILPVSEMPEIVAHLMNAMNAVTIDAQH